MDKWRAEALAIPNEHWWRLATSAKWQRWDTDGRVVLQSNPSDSDDYIPIPEDIMTNEAFDCVRRASIDLDFSLTCGSASRNFVVRLSTLSRLELYQLSMLVQA